LSVQLHDSVKTVEKKQKGEASSEKMLAKNTSQRSRGKYQRKSPEKLAQLIDLVNCFPPYGSLELRLLHPETLKQQTEAELKEEGGRDNDFFHARLGECIFEHINSLPDMLTNYVGWGAGWSTRRAARGTGRLGSVNQLMSDGGVVGRYEKLWNASMRLRRIAQLAKAEPSMYAAKSLLYLDPVPLPVLDEIDEQGFVHVSRDLFTQAMDGEDVEAARIRECLICKRLFWAGRIDAQQCGAARCKTALSSRLNRNPELRELYNKARRTKRRKQNEARGQTQSSAKKRKKRNGNL